jgi:hypothetical protein
MPATLSAVISKGVETMFVPWPARLLFLTGMFAASPAIADDVPADTIREAIEGTWVLEEWNVDGARLAPPEATGRLTLHDNVIVIITTQQKFGWTKSFFGYGIYAADTSTWSYRYEQYSIVEATPSKALLTRELPWEGLRTFKASVDGDKLVFDYEDGKAQIVISGDEFFYNETGALVRRWKRVTP